MLIHRVFAILDRKFYLSPEIHELLTRILACDSSASFIVLNWDIVLERHLQELNRQVNYEADEFPWEGGIQPAPFITRVIKVHGSSNWVYCDNCRQVFSDADRKLSLVINAGLLDDDFKLFDHTWPDNGIEKLTGLTNRDCPRCRSPVGPHIATFSYRKSFRSAAFARSWAKAEEVLSSANRWLFIGYSLPHADYDFAHMLKTAELKLARPTLRPIHIDVVLRKDKAAEARFRQMFGAAISKVSHSGLNGYVKRGLGKFLAWLSPMIFPDKHCALLGCRPCI